MLSMVEIVALRCLTCGDTFTLHAEEEPVCRSCGSDRLASASEPLL
jgi:rRNA maturation endonuclease Nob1